MKVTDHIKQAKGKTLFSFEIVPPQKGQNIQELYDNINPLMEFKPPFIDVTTSREEHLYISKEKWTFGAKNYADAAGNGWHLRVFKIQIQCGCDSARVVWRIYEGRNGIFVGGLSLFGPGQCDGFAW